MGNPDLIKDITRKQLEIKNTETSDVLLREMLYNILDIKEDAPTDTQLLPLFNQDLENIFQAFGTFAKNGNMYQNQNTFDKSKILTDFKNWIKDDDNVKTLDARTGDEKLHFKVTVWNNYLLEIIKLQEDKDTEIQAVIGWAQKEEENLKTKVEAFETEQLTGRLKKVQDIFKKYPNVEPKAELINTIQEKEENKRQGQFQDFQKTIGMSDGDIDGKIGPKTLTALKEYLQGKQEELKIQEKLQIRNGLENDITAEIHRLNELKTRVSTEQTTLIDTTIQAYEKLKQKPEQMTDDVITKTEKEFETTEKEFTNEWENLQTLQQVTTSNRDILNKKIGDNKRKIEALENEIYNWDTQTETIIQQQKNKKDYSDKSITDYRSSRMTIKKGKQEELKRLKTTQQALDRAIKSPDFLQQHTETEINTFIQNLEAQQQSSLQSTTTGEYQKTEYEQIGDLSLESYEKLPKNQKKALQLLIKEYKKDVDIDKLEEKKQKELRKLFENLKDIKTKINGPSAIRLMDKLRQEKPRPTTVEKRQEKILKNVQTTNGGYAWKKGKEKRKEGHALEKFAKIYFDAYSEIQADGISVGSVLHSVFLSFFRETSDADRTGISEQHLAMSQKQLHSIDTQELSKSLTNAENTLIHLIANLDNNTALDTKAKEAFSELQVTNAYIDAKRLLYLEQGIGTSLDDPALSKAIIKNIVKAMEHSVQGRYADNLKLVERRFYTEENGNKVLKDMSPEELIKNFKEYPNLLEVFQNVLRGSGEHIKQVFIEGDNWAQTEEQVVLEKEQAQASAQTEVVQIDNIEVLTSSPEIPQLPEGVDATIEGRIEGAYSEFLTETREILDDNKKRLAELEKKDDLTPEEQEEKETLQTLTSPELQQSLQDLEKNKPENLKAIKINIVGAMYSRLQENFENITKDQNGNIMQHDKSKTVKQGVGIGANITSEKINAWLTKNTKGRINSLNLTPTLGIANDGQGNNTGMLGIGVNLAGSKDLGKKWEMVYVAGGGAGVSTSGQLFAGPWMSIGFLKEYGIKKMKGTLDPKALKQAGVIFTGTLTNLGINGVWNRDKQKGIQEEMNIIKDDLTKFINDMIPPSGEVKYDTIFNTLNKQFNNVKDKKNISYFAHDLFNLLKPFENKLKVGGEDKVISQGKVLEGQSLLQRQSQARNAIIAAKAEQFANIWANQNTTNLKKGFLNGFHLSGASIGIILGMSYIPVTGGLKFTRYKNEQWNVDSKSQEKANERFQYGYGAKKIQDQTFGTLAKRLNEVLNDYNATTQTPEEGNPEETQPSATYIEQDESRGVVKIHKSILTKLNLHLLPELKPYILTEGDSIIVPDFFPVAFHIHSGDTTKQTHLIIGSLGVKNTEHLSDADFQLFNRNSALWKIRMEDAQQKLGVKPMELTDNVLGNEVLRNRLLTNIRKNFTEAKTFFNDPNFPIDIDKIEIIERNNAYTLRIPSLSGSSSFKTPEIDNIQSFSKISIKRMLDKTQNGTYQEGPYQIHTTPQTTGSQSFEIAYGKEELGNIVTKEEKVEAKALKDSQDAEVLSYFSSPDSTPVLLAMRKKNGGALKQKIYKAVKDGQHETIAVEIKDFLSRHTPQSQGLTDALQKFDSTNPSKEMLRGNVNFLYAALSRVDATEFKQVGERFEQTEKDEMLKNAEGLANSLGWNPTQKALLKTRIDETADGKNTDGTSSATWVEIAKLLGYPPTRPSPYNTANNAKARLYWMMADINEIINYRASSFERRLKNETQFKQAGGNDAFKELIDKKKKLQQQLNYPFDNAEAKDGYTALVFGYQGDGAGHQEKFISSPLMVKETSDNIIEKQTKKYFLENLQNFDKAYNTFAQTKDKIIDTMKEIDGAFNTTISDQDIIDALVEGKEITLTVNGKEQKITLSADFNLGFFADCINEAIMMSPIDIKYTGEFQEIQYKEKSSSIVNNLGGGSQGVSVVTTDVVRNVSLKEKHFVAGAVAGWKNTKNEEETYTDPGFTEEETYTDPGYTEEGGNPNRDANPSPDPE